MKSQADYSSRNAPRGAQLVDKVVERGETRCEVLRGAMKSYKMLNYQNCALLCTRIEWRRWKVTILSCKSQVANLKLKVLQIATFHSQPKVWTSKSGRTARGLLLDQPVTWAHRTIFRVSTLKSQLLSFPSKLHSQPSDKASTLFNYPSRLRPNLVERSCSEFWITQNLWTIVNSINKSRLRWLE